MKKYALTIYNLFICLIATILIVSITLLSTNFDKIVTENIILEFFEDSMNDYKEDNLKEFVANSENDQLFINAKKAYLKYNQPNVTDFEFDIDEYESFGTGKYQCYLDFDNIPSCDLKNEGKYANFLIETTTSYKNIYGSEIEIKEKGIVVFIKDPSKGNVFDWKLVRYEAIKIE